MDQREYRALLERGSGRAILYASENDVGHLRQTIMDACLQCLAIDPQSEGTRASYMRDLLDRVPDRSSYCDAVLDSLARCGDDWHAVQRFHFGVCLAAEGNARARRVMYDNFRPGPRMGSGIACEFVELDGFDGLCFAADHLGALVMEGAVFRDLDWLLIHSGQSLGEEAVRDALAAEAALNPRVAAFLAAVEAPRPPRQRQRRSLLERPPVAAAHADLLAQFAADADRDRRHRIGLDMLRLWEERPDAATEVVMLRALFESGPCSFCRESALRRLLKLGAVTPEMVNECAWDANPDIRSLAGAGS